MSRADEAVDLFVYGSLLSGEVNHALLEGALPLGSALTPPEYYLVELNSGAALVPGGRLQVHGELFRVTLEMLRTLDKHQQHPTLYNRQRITLADGRVAHSYLMTFEQVRGRRRLKLGDYRRRFSALPAYRDSAWSRWARDRFKK
jgi:gamma-glutamylcyclotransferase (GGCT)/AIG2-like uncharacterized protein YtfP